MIAESRLKDSGAPQQVYVARFEGENEFGDHYAVREYLIRPVGVPLKSHEVTWGYQPVSVVDSVQGALF